MARNHYYFTFESLCDGEKGYACNFTVDIPQRTDSERAKQILIGHINRCRQRFRERQRVITAVDIGRTYIPAIGVAPNPERNPEGWNLRGIRDQWKDVKGDKDGLVVLSVVSQDHPPAEWDETLQDYASSLAEALKQHYKRYDRRVRLENRRLDAGRRARIDHPKFALYMAYNFQERVHPMDMDIAADMEAMYL